MLTKLIRNACSNKESKVTAIDASGERIGPPGAELIAKVAALKAEGNDKFTKGEPRAAIVAPHAGLPDHVEAHWTAPGDTVALRGALAACEAATDSWSMEPVNHDGLRSV